MPVDRQPAVNIPPPAVRQISADNQPPAVQSVPAHSQPSAGQPPLTVTPAAELPADTSPPPSDHTCAEGDPAAFLPAMPHIADTFYDFDEWTDALMNALGACIYISESLAGDGTYTVYSHEYEGEDTYLTETTEDGFIVQ